VEYVSLQEGIPWGGGARQVLAHLKTEVGDDTKKKVSLLNRSKAKLKDPKKIKTLEKVLSMLQEEPTPGKDGVKKDTHAEFKAKVDAALGNDNEQEPAPKEKDTHKAVKEKIDAALGDDSVDEPKKEKSKHSEIKAKVDAALGADDEKELSSKDREAEARAEVEKALGPDTEPSGGQKKASDLKSEIEAALSSGSGKTDKEGTASSNVLAQPEKPVIEEPPVISGSSLGGGPGMAEVSSAYAKKESANPEASKVLKRIGSFSQNHPNTSKVISAGLGGINPAVAHYQSAKAYKENPTSSTGMVSKHPTMTSALIGGPTGVAASASYFARKEEGKPRVEAWENVADFASNHQKTASILGGGGVNPSLAYFYASKQKKPKKIKTSDTGVNSSDEKGEESLETR
jgi:hypothetical protein